MTGVTCKYFLCKHHKEEKCILDEIVVEIDDNEGYLSAVCASYEDRKYKKGLGLDVTFLD